MKKKKKKKKKKKEEEEVWPTQNYSVVLIIINR